MNFISQDGTMSVTTTSATESSTSPHCSEFYHMTSVNVPLIYPTGGPGSPVAPGYEPAPLRGVQLHPEQEIIPHFLY